MKDQDKTRDQLLAELADLRRRLAATQAEPPHIPPVDVDQQPINHRDVVPGTGQDTAQRRLAGGARDLAAEAVRQSEQRMRLHVDQTPLAVIEWNLQLCVSKWNPGAERIFGYTAAEALARHFTFILPRRCGTISIACGPRSAPERGRTQHE